MSVIQVAFPSIITTLQRRPDVCVVAQIVVTAIGIAVASGQNPAVKNNHFILFAFLKRKAKIRYLAIKREDYWTDIGSLAYAFGNAQLRPEYFVQI